jgi:hypothetical protein
MDDNDNWIIIDTKEQIMIKFITMCKGDDIKKLLEFIIDLNLYDTEFIQSCHVQGFECALKINNMIICKTLYDYKMLTDIQNEKFIEYWNIIGKDTSVSYKKFLMNKLGIIHIETQAQDQDQYQECIICMDSADMKLSCGHILCINCAYDWYLIKDKPKICYLCQQPFNMSDSIICVSCI